MGRSFHASGVSSVSRTASVCSIAAVWDSGWLANARTTSSSASVDFWEIPSVHPDPQLVYAMLERFTGMGYATEMARTVITEARRQPGFNTIVAAVDEMNVASVRVLYKIGFRQVATQTGSVGNVLVMLLDGTDRIGR